MMSPGVVAIRDRSRSGRRGLSPMGAGRDAQRSGRPVDRLEVRDEAQARDRLAAVGVEPAGAEVARALRPPGQRWSSQESGRQHRELIEEGEAHRSPFAHHHDALELDAAGARLHVAQRSEAMLQRAIDLG